MIAGIPEAPEQITAAWLGHALQRPVAQLRTTRIGENESFSGGGLFRLEFDRGESLIAKLSPAAPGLRTAFARANRREVTFYTELGHGLPVPRCAFAEVDPASGASVLLLQDMAGCRAGNFVAGLSPGDTRAVIEALAAIHARWWQQPAAVALQGAGWLNEFDFPAIWRAYPRAVARLLPDCELPDSFIRLGDFLAVDGEQVFASLMEGGPLTALHRDCHVDNVMFARDGAAVLLDWQMLGKGRGVCDVAYTLISSLPPALRRAEEVALVRGYHDALLRGGVTGYGGDSCWLEYRRAVVCKLFVSAVATVLLDNSSPPKTAWRRADLVRLLAFCDDHQITPRLFAHRIAEG